jgi:UDP-N-acetylglucosamine acyltransferase
MDVAPYCMVSGARAELGGLNTIGLQRAGMTEEQIGRVKQAYKVVFRQGLKLEEAVAQLQAELGQHPEVAHFAGFLAATQRGVTR